MGAKNGKFMQVLLAIVLCLLMSSTATAQSRVVLWEQEQVMEVKDGTLAESSEWKLVAASLTSEQCTEAQRQAFEVRTRDYTALKEKFPKMEVWTTPHKAVTVRSTLEPILFSSVFHCLPGTVDPRKR